MNFTDREKQLLLSNAPVLSRITLYDEDGSVLQVFNEDDYIVDWEYEDYRYVPDQGFIGQFVERLLDGNFMNIPDELSLEDKEIEVEIAVVDNLLQEQVYHNYGRFIITKIEKGDVSGSYKFESSDYAKKFNVPITNTISYPCTSLELLNNVCEIAGVELDTNGECLSFCVPKEGLTAGTYYFAVTDDAGTTTNYEFELDTNVRFHDTLMLILDENKLILKTIDDNYKIDRRELTYVTVETSSGTLLNENLIGYVDFINNDFVVEDNQFEEQDSCRTVVSSIAKLGYTWARINEDNKLCLDFVKNEDVDSYDEIDTDKYYEARVTGDKVEPVNKVLIGMSNVDGENIVKEQDTDLLRVNKISGETSQDSYSGKNLLNYNVEYAAGTTTTIAGVTVKFNNDGSITLNGTMNANNIEITGGTNKLKLNVDNTKSYYSLVKVISGSFTKSGTVQPLIAYEVRYDSGSSVYYRNYALPSSTTSTALNVTDAEYITRYRLWQDSSLGNTTFNNYTIKLAIYQNDNTTEWEQYFGGESSPNPRYPQEVESVRGNNKLKIVGKNLCDGIWELGNIQDDGTEVSSTNTYKSVNYYTVKGGETLICSYIATSGTQLNWCACYDKNKIFMTRLTNLKKNPFTLPNNTVYIRIGFYKSGGISTDDFSDVMLEYGSQSTIYEPYQETVKSFNLPVENLFNKNSTNVLSAYINASGKIVTDVQPCVVYIPCNSNTNYAIQKAIQPTQSSNRFKVGCCSSIPAINTQLSKYNNLPNGTIETAMIFKTDSTAKYLVFNFAGGSPNEYQAVLDSIQIEEGSKVNSYTPYTYDENLFDKDNPNIVNGYLDTGTGMYLDTAQLNRILYIPCKPNTPYVISRSILTTTFRVATYDSTPFPSATSTGTNYNISGLIKDNNASVINITTGNNAKYLVVHYGRVETDPNIDESLATIQIKEHIKPIELNKVGAYQDYITKSTGKNLFDGDISQGRWTSNVNTIIFSEPEKRGFRNTNPIYIKPNTNYVISGTIPTDTSTIWLVETDNNGIILAIDGNYGFKQFTYTANQRSSMVLKTHESARKLYWYTVGTNVTNYPIDFMVEEGDVVTTYEPYGYNEWYVYKRVYPLLFDISKPGNISYVSGNSDANYSQFNISNMSNWKRIGYGSGGEFKNKYFSLYNGAGNPDKTRSGMRIWSNNINEPQIVISFPTPLLTTGQELNSFKDWLTQHSSYIYAELLTPETEKITYQPLIDQLNELDKVGLFKGINYITTDTLNEIPTLDITTTNLEQEETNYSNKSFDITSSDYSEGGTINVFDNPLTHSEELRRIAINGSENLLGLTYTPMEVESIGHPWLSGKEYMKVTNLQDDDLFFYPFDRKMKYNGALTTDLSAEAEDDTSQKYENRDNVIDRLHHTEIDVDKANQQITSLVQEVSDTNDKMTKVTQDVNSVSTQVESINKSVDDNTKNIATIQQTIAGISVETSITGGTNLIKNSVGYFGNDFWMVNDDTEGNVKTMNDNDVKNNSISANALLLQNETIYQKITEIKNGSYYISFRYKRLLTTATCKLIINGEEFNLTSTSWKDEGKEIPVTSNNIQISLVSNKNDSCLVTDLIVSNGTSKVSWTQNANETFTDGVKIGKGITITATGSDTELSATASSIDIVNTRNRESTSTFDKYGIKTNSLESKGTIRVADKLIISRVGDQMWISTL